jgi:hypothetical protein
MNISLEFSFRIQWTAKWSVLIQYFYLQHVIATASWSKYVPATYNEMPSTRSAKWQLLQQKPPLLTVTKRSSKGRRHQKACAVQVGGNKTC